jgi:hypothetical protein
MQELNQGKWSKYITGFKVAAHVFTFVSIVLSVVIKVRQLMGINNSESDSKKNDSK